MRGTIAVVVFLLLGGLSSLYSDTSKPTGEMGKLLIDPSATSVTLGKVSLTVSPLKHRDGNYIGNYRLKVRPYYFKSEKGSLVLVASADSVRKLHAGTAINFTGTAVTEADGRIHIVLGRAIPSSTDRGRVTFSIATDDGELVFDTSYHFDT